MRTDSRARTVGNRLNAPLPLTVSIINTLMRGSTMSRAARFDEFGPASVLKVVDLDEPQAGPGQVRVRVKAAGLNPADYKRRNGGSQYVVELPSGIGRELAGIVDQVGEGVSRLSPGDEVFGTVADGAIAEHVVAGAATFAIKPAEVSWAVAGGLALVGQTAHDALVSQHLTDADTVLVSAAAGGVGLITAQLARLAGATVIGTAGEGNHEFLKQLGVIPISYGPGLADRLRTAAPQGVTVVFDHHGAETIEAAIELGVDKARINTIATDPTRYGTVRVGRGPNNTATLDTLARLVATGELVVPIEANYGLTEVVAAYDRLEQGHLRGKVVIVF